MPFPSIAGRAVSDPSAWRDQLHRQRVTAGTPSSRQRVTFPTLRHAPQAASGGNAGGVGRGRWARHLHEFACVYLFPIAGRVFVRTAERSTFQPLESKVERNAPR